MNLRGDRNILLITTLAEYQTAFWVPVGLELRRRGVTAAFLSFDDRSTESLRGNGLETFAACDAELSADVSDPAFDEVVAEFGITDVNYWCSHERITFGISDSLELRSKLVVGLRVAERACRDLQARGLRVTLVQELGGFLSVIASYFAARRCRVDNWFIEPAFFRGRMFFLRNRFAANVVDGRTSAEVSGEVSGYLEQTLATGAIVIPRKDRHHYATAFSKVVNARNLRRLVEKIVDKYLHGKRQEFGYISRHVMVHARMLQNSIRLRGSYTPLERLGRFIYFPLHVPADVALTLRSPEYLDQLALIDYLARIVPHTHRVVVKEHPAMIGAIDAGRLISLMRRHDNLALLPPSTNNFDVLRASEAVVSINSKSGAEASLLGKPVMVLGDAFYRDSPLVERVDSLSELPNKLCDVLSRSPTLADPNAIGRYFETVWRQCFPGELYVTDSSNVTVFVDSLLGAVEEGVAEREMS